MELLEGQTDRDAALQTMPAQAENDGRLIALWLAGKADRTRRAYRDDLAAFQRFTDKPLCQITLAGLVAYSETLGRFAPASRARKIGALKSLASFGHRIGYLAFDIGAPLRLSAVKNTLAERILGECDVHRLLALEPHPRNHALLRLLYAGALRVSELCALTWRDLQPREDADQVTVFGKGGKTRVVLLTPGVWGELAALHKDAGENDPVFRSGKGMRAMRSTAAPQSRSCRPHSDMRRSPRRGGIFTPARTTARPGICRSDAPSYARRARKARTGQAPGPKKERAPPEWGPPGAGSVAVAARPDQQLCCAVAADERGLLGPPGRASVVGRDRQPQGRFAPAKPVAVGDP